MTCEVRTRRAGPQHVAMAVLCNFIQAGVLSNPSERPKWDVEDNNSKAGSWFLVLGSCRCLLVLGSCRCHVMCVLWSVSDVGRS